MKPHRDTSALLQHLRTTSGLQSYSEALPLVHGMLSNDIATNGPRRKSGSTVSIYLEGPFETGTEEMQSFTIETPNQTTQIDVRTVIAGGTTSRIPSPAFLAAKRRRRCSDIINDISALEKNSDDESLFQIWTAVPLEKLKNLLHELDQASTTSLTDTEGNSCEVLRQVRDLFLRTGWRQFRHKSVRELVIARLSVLAHEEEVSPRFASETMDKFLEAGLDPCVGAAETEVYDVTSDY